MCAILKTLPIRFARGRLEEFLGVNKPTFCVYYFTLGRGRPRRPDAVTEIFFTHRSRIIGHFEIEEIVRNEGQLPKLTTLDGGPSEWQIKPDAWVAVCRPPFHPLRSKVYHSGFRGWRYFDLKTYSVSIDAKVLI
jgi:hypothetical protein